MARLDPEEGFDLLKDRVQKAVSSLFPIVGKKNTLELHDVTVKDDLDSADIRLQKSAKLAGKSWDVPLEATVSLKDNATGKVLDRQKIKLLNLPKPTNRYSYIVDGQENQVDNQWRLKPGVYNMVKADGALESHFNAPGGGFKINFDPATREFSMGYGNSNIPLKPLLHAMGLPEEDVERRWGKEITAANHADMSKALAKFYKANTGLKPTASMTLEDKRAHFWQVMNDTKMNPDVNMLTLGKGHSNVTGAALLDASDKLLKISRGEAKSDPRDALMFKDLHSMEDFAAERITRGSKDILRKIGNTVDRKDKVRDIIAPDIFNKHIRQMFSKNSLSSPPSQVNPLEMLSAQFKTTIMGQGGIKSEHTVSDEAKLIDPSHLGFLDPIETPEGKDTGIVLRLPVGVRKKGHDVTIRMFNLHTGKNEDVNPTTAHRSHVVLPDQVRWVAGKPVPIGPSIKISGIENEIYEGPMKGADYVMSDPMQMFSYASNLIPFMPADHPNRSTMAGRQMEQAVSLLHREAPLVQSLAGTHSFDHMLGGFASHHTRVDGTVTQNKPDAVVIKGTDGKRHEVQIYDHFPLNEDKAFLHSMSVVKVGDKVTAGQTVADTNFSKNGVLAMGTNLRVGFMPYKGLNYEDGIVVTESAAKRLTSEHLHRHTMEKTVANVLDKRKFQAYIPTGLNRAQAEKLDEEGVVKPGTLVMPGDTLIAVLRASNESEKREDIQLSKLHKSIVRPFKDESIKWDNDYPGVVKEVIKTGANVAVHIKTEEPLEIGDKIAGRHGNKGICHDQITEVLTDSGWKYWKDLDKTELLCTRNQATGKVEYQKPISYTSYRYKGRMYSYEGRRLNLRVTPNHNHFVRTRRGEFHLESAESCFGLPRIHLRTGEWVGNELDTIHIAGRPYIDGQTIDYSEDLVFDADLFLEFFGYWITEGSLSRDYCVVLAQSREVHPETYERMTQVVCELGYEPSCKDTTIVINDVRLVTWLKQFGQSHDKFVPREFLNATPRQLRIMADAMFEGDGGVYYREKDNHTRYELFTSSKQLADDYQELALKLGMSANIKPQKGEHGTEYVVRWSLKDEVWTNNDKRFDNEAWVDYDGMVYCAEVPNHVIYVRRNGVPVWSGNCVAIIPDHESPHTKDGRVLDVILNPLGVTGRTNLGQVLEVAAGKIAEKTGRTYFIKNFKPGADLHAQVTQDLAKNDLTDKETVYDSANERPMGDVLVGPMHILKLHHQVEKKLSARALGYGYAYDRNKIPKGGGPHGAQSLGVLGLYAMLAHGALCFSAGTTIRTTSGKRMEISDIVRLRKQLDVLSWNPESGLIESKPIVEWSCRVANPDELIKITVVANDPSRRKHAYKIKVTSGHQFYTPNGKVEAGDLIVGSRLLMQGVKLHPIQRQLILGSTLGDGSLTKNGHFSSMFSVVHGAPQEEYCRYKYTICNGLVSAPVQKVLKSKGSYSDGSKFRFRTLASAELSTLRDLFYPRGKKIIPGSVLDELTEIGLAFWFMDDGNTDIQTSRPQKYRTVRLATCGFSTKDCELARSWFRDRWGLKCTIQVKGGKYPYLHFFNAAAIKFLKLVAPYVHPQLQYKLRLEIEHSGFSKKEAADVGALCSSLCVRAQEGLEEVSVLRVEPQLLKRWEDYLVYNIEVEGNHNYFADGILVGNSNIREMNTWKSDSGQGDQFWAALQAGELLPTPKPTFAYNKFISLIKGTECERGEDWKQSDSLSDDGQTSP